MKKKVWLITKEEVAGKQRKLGYIERRNDDIYYDFTLINGSHDSYHRDGSEWRTNKLRCEKAVKVKDNVPPQKFKGVYKLCVCLLQKQEIPFLPEVKERDKNQHILIEVDMSQLPSPLINIMIEMVEPQTKIPNEGETAIPDKAVVYEIQELDPWFIVTILGHKENLLFDVNSETVKFGHINERYTANAKGVQYELEGSMRNRNCISIRVKELKA